MDIVSLCPFRVAPLVWEARPGEWTLTVCVKATFMLENGTEAVVAESQRPLDDDRFFTDAALSSLRSPGDFAPFKPKADILLVGHAYAPSGVPAESVVATLKVGEWSKSVQVTGDRALVQKPSGWEPGPASPFTHQALRYERAAIDVNNPVGIDVHRTTGGAPMVPNLQAIEPGHMPGFGPISPEWRARRSVLRDDALLWAHGVTARGRVSAGPAPHDLDFSFFNAAPPEQQVALLRAGVTIELSHLHPVHARFRTRLPPLRPKAFVADPQTGRAREIALRCDTLWIDTDEGLATVTWRGLCDVASGDERALPRVVVAVEAKESPVRLAHVDRALRDGNVGLAAHAGATPPPDSHPLGQRHDAVKPSHRADPFAWTGGFGVSGERPAAAPIVEEESTHERDGRGSTRKLTAMPLRDALPFRGAAPVIADPETGGEAPTDRILLREKEEVAGALVATEDTTRDDAKRLSVIDEMTGTTTLTGGQVAEPTAAPRGPEAVVDERLAAVSAADYARLVVAVERGAARVALAQAELSAAAFRALVHLWIRRAEDDPNAAAAVVAAVDAAREAER